jgi:hypothetical protein
MPEPQTIQRFNDLTIQRKLMTTAPAAATTAAAVSTTG